MLVILTCDHRVVKPWVSLGLHPLGYCWRILRAAAFVKLPRSFLAPALSTAWRGSRRREFASSIQRAAASPQLSPRSGEGVDGESSPAVSFRVKRRGRLCALTNQFPRPALVHHP